MLAEKAFFSFATVTDPSKHRAYNEWHQLDHRPENLALDGVRYGERWVLSPDCAEVADLRHPELAGTHYVNSYWFREPASASIAEWQGLAERSFQWGRRPDVAWTSRPLMGFFSTVRGVASRRVLVSADALPFRPNRGVHLTVSQVGDAHGPDAERSFAWHDRIWVPELLDCPGVAGVWTFSSDSTTLDPSWRAVPGSTTFDAAGSDRGHLRITLAFLDEDPVDVAQAIAVRSDRLGRAARGPGGAETTLLSAPLRAIAPWEWDWFEGAAGGEERPSGPVPT